jgi:hypothetical protein
MGKVKNIYGILNLTLISESLMCFLIIARNYSLLVGFEVESMEIFMG